MSCEPLPEPAVSAHQALLAIHDKIRYGGADPQHLRVHLLGSTWELRILSATSAEFVVAFGYYSVCVVWTLQTDAYGVSVLIWRESPNLNIPGKAVSSTTQLFRDPADFLGFVMRQSCEIVTAAEARDAG